MQNGSKLAWWCKTSTANKKPEWVYANNYTFIWKTTASKQFFMIRTKWTLNKHVKPYSGRDKSQIPFILYNCESTNECFDLLSLGRDNHSWSPGQRHIFHAHTCIYIYRYMHTHIICLSNKQMLDSWNYSPYLHCVSSVISPAIKMHSDLKSIRKITSKFRNGLPESSSLRTAKDAWWILTRDNRFPHPFQYPLLFEIPYPISSLWIKFNDNRCWCVI